MAGMPKILPLLCCLLLIHVNANPVANEATNNEASWLTKWQKCFFNDVSEDVGHFVQTFLTRLMNCWPTTTAIEITEEEEYIESSTHYLIAGGYAHGYAHGVSTEVIDLSNSQPMDPDTFGDLPTKFVHHVGGLLGSNPILCGGKDKDDSCFSWKKTVDSSSQWTETHTMTTKRFAPASIELNSTTMWIIGGQNVDKDEVIDSSEFVGLDSNVGKIGPKLPYGVVMPCLVKKSQDQVYMIGGYDSSYSLLNKVLIFNPTNGFTHMEGPSLITKRARHHCGLMTNGQQTKIVVAGGRGENGYLSSVEIFDPIENNWSPGPTLPYRLHSSAIATSPDGRGVILFGGYSKDKGTSEDTILELRYDSNNQMMDRWTRLPQKLKTVRSKHVVIPIS